MKITCSVSEEGSITSMTGDSHFTIFEGPGEELNTVITGEINIKLTDQMSFDAFGSNQAALLD